MYTKFSVHKYNYKIKKKTCLGLSKKLLAVQWIYDTPQRTLDNLPV